MLEGFNLFFEIDADSGVNVSSKNEAHPLLLHESNNFEQYLSTIHLVVYAYDSHTNCSDLETFDGLWKMLEGFDLYIGIQIDRGINMTNFYGYKINYVYSLHRFEFIIDSVDTHIVDPKAWNLTNVRRF